MSMIGTGFERILNAFYSPKATQTFGNMSAGQQYGEARANADELAYQRNLQEQLLRQQQEHQNLRNANIISQIEHRNRPPGMNNASTNDIRNHQYYLQMLKEDPTGKKAKDFLSMSGPIYKPSYIDLPTDGGGSQKFETTPEGLKPIGPEKIDQTKARESRASQEVIERTNVAYKKYRDLLGQHGTELWPGKAKLELQSAYKNLLLEMKELYNLGVLSGPDEAIMESIIQDPTSIGNQLYGGDDLINQLDTVVGEKLGAARKYHENTYGALPQQENTQNSDVSSVAMPPQIGEQRGGYIYIGGDPSQEASWSRVNE